MNRTKNIILMLVVLVILVACGFGGRLLRINHEATKQIHQEKLNFQTSLASSVSYAHKFQLQSNMNLEAVFEEVFLYPEKYTKITYRLDSAGVKPAYKGEIIYYPSPNTDVVLENLNNYIDEEAVNVALYNLHFPLTMNDVLAQPHDISELVKDMEQSDYSRTFICSDGVKSE